MGWNIFPAKQTLQNKTERVYYLLAKDGKTDSLNAFSWMKD